MQVLLNRICFSLAPAWASLAFSLGSVASAGAKELPNIVIIYADDLGYGDLSCYNPKAAYKTPRLDRMAKEGIRFTDAHSPSTICSPSRYGLYSGQLVCRTGRGSRAFEGPGGPSYLKPGELTIAGQLYNLGKDPGEAKNLFFSEPEKRRELQALLKKLTAEENGRSAPKNRKPMGIKLFAHPRSETTRGKK